MLTAIFVLALLFLFAATVTTSARLSNEVDEPTTIEKVAQDIAMVLATALATLSILRYLL